MVPLARGFVPVEHAHGRVPVQPVSAFVAPRQNVHKGAFNKTRPVMGLRKVSGAHPGSKPRDAGHG
jgi:hypothetical protein